MLLNSVDLGSAERDENPWETPVLESQEGFSEVQARILQGRKCENLR